MTTAACRSASNEGRPAKSRGANLLTDETVAAGTAKAAEAWPSSMNANTVRVASCGSPLRGGPGPPQPHRNAAPAWRIIIVVVAVELAQRRQNIGKPDGVAHARYLA